MTTTKDTHVYIYALYKLKTRRLFNRELMCYAWCTISALAERAASFLEVTVRLGSKQPRYLDCFMQVHFSKSNVAKQKDSGKDSFSCTYGDHRSTALKNA